MFGPKLPANVKEGLADAAAGRFGKTMEVPLAYTPALKAAAVARLEAALAEGRFSQHRYLDERANVGSPVAFISLWDRPVNHTNRLETRTEQAPGGDQTDFHMCTGLSPFIPWIFEPIYRGLPKDEADAWAIAFFRDHLPGNFTTNVPALWGELAVKMLVDSRMGVLKFAAGEAHATLIQSIAQKLGSKRDDAGKDLQGLIKVDAPKGAVPWNASPASEAAVYAALVIIERTQHLEKKEHPAFAKMALASEMMSGMAASQALRSAAEAFARDAAQNAPEGTDPRVCAEAAKVACHQQQVAWLQEAILRTNAYGTASDWRKPLDKAAGLLSRVPGVGGFRSAVPATAKPVPAARTEGNLDDTLGRDR